MNKKLVLIDGHSILNRAFYGVPDLTNSEGIHTNAVYGFLNIMLKILNEEQPEYLIVAFDVKHPTFRHEMFAEYKGTRSKMQPELSQQVPIIKDLLKAMDIHIVEQAGVEADDILGSYATKAQEEGIDVCLVSGDRDTLQIASKRIQIRIPKTKKTGTIVENYYEQDEFNFCITKMLNALKDLKFDIIKDKGIPISEEIYIEIWIEDNWKVKNWTD